MKNRVKTLIIYNTIVDRKRQTLKKYEKYMHKRGKLQYIKSSETNES